MKHFLLKHFLHLQKKLLAVILLVAVLPATLFSQIPEGGTSLIRDFYNHFSVNGSNVVTKVAVEGQSFSNAFNCRIGAGVANPWNAQLLFSPETGIETGDVILITFWARTTESLDETGSGLLTVCIEHRTNYDKVIYQTQHISAEWEQFFIPLTSISTLTAANMALGFHMGYPSQTIQVADVKFINYKKEYSIDQMPVTIPTYTGREEDAPWRAGAEYRINQFRKGNMKIRVVDSEGNPLAGKSVLVSMKRHKFAFGSAIVADTYLSNATYREKIKELFNEVVFENDLKMGMFSTRSPIQKNRILQVIDDLDASNITVRGHTTVWPSFRYNPNHLQNFRTDPERLRFEIDKHIEEITTFFKGRLLDWDVLNEPFTEHEWMDILGKEVMADWFNQVQNYDPNVKLYINDFGILSGMGLNAVKQNAYMETVKYIEEKGGRIDGIGMQGHFAEGLTSIERVKLILDKFEELGKEIKITEFDIDSDRRDLQADYKRDFMTMVFSHPAVKGFLMWGFWESRHWRARAAMFDADWTIREHGEMYRDLVFNRWWTHDTILETDHEGYITMEGFLGTYQITIDNNDQSRQATIELKNANSSGRDNHFVISTNPAIPVSLTITKDGNTIFCQGGQLKLTADIPENFTIKWYEGDELLEELSNTLTVSGYGYYHAVAEAPGFTITSDSVYVQTWINPPSEITVEGNTRFVQGEQVKLHATEIPGLTYRWFKDGQYFRGSTKSITVKEPGIYTVETIYAGCRTLSEPVLLTDVTGYDSLPDHNNEWIRVFPNPFQQSFTIDLSSLCQAECSIRLLDITGRLKYSTELKHSTHLNLQPEVVPGVYLLEVTSHDRTQRIRVLKN